jgi:DNA-binding NarL/FixJ family response regulator
MSKQEDNTIRILLANDQELIRVGLRMIFQSESDLELVEMTDNFEDTLFLSQKYVPDIVLFDYMFGESNCKLQKGNCKLLEDNYLSREGNYIERLPELLSACPSSKILILTACQNREIHLYALRQGAIGVFILNQSIQMLIKAIHKVYSGEVWLTNSLTNGMLFEFNKPEPSVNIIPVPISNALTPRELTIARLLAQGFLVKQIAEKLFISEKTVRNQLVIIYSKLGIHNHIELLLQATSLGLREPDS